MRIELAVAIISGVVALASAVIAYMAQAHVASSQEQIVRLQSALQQSHERQKPFLERQMQHYFEATDVAAKIANFDEKPERQDAVRRFWQLYWGSLAVVEDPEVESAMVSFGNALQQQNPTKATLQHLSLELAHACRNSLQKLWGTNLGELRNLREGHRP